MRTALIDVGGGMRGIYASGVLDFCLENKIKFDLCIGISAGSANISSFLAGQEKRNYKFYMEYSARREYMSFYNFIKKGSFVDLDYVYGTLSNHDGEYPLDYKAFTENPAEFLIVATNALTGEAKYFSKQDIKEDNFGALKASCCLPFVNKAYYIDGVPYYDGALSDSIPLQKAFDNGCDKVVVILTRPRDYSRNNNSDKRLAAGIRKRFPKAAEKLVNRAELYNKELDMAKELEKQGKVLIVAPKTIYGMKTLSRSDETLQNLYDMGYADAESISSFIPNTKK